MDKEGSLSLVSYACVCKLWVVRQEIKGHCAFGGVLTFFSKVDGGEVRGLRVGKNSENLRLALRGEGAV